MKQLIEMQKLAFFIVALLAAVATSRCNAAAAIRMQLTHADAGGRGLAGRELMQRMALRSKARVARLLSSSATAPVSPGGCAGGVLGSSEYLVHLAIGTPPQPGQLTLDTGSDLIWTQCTPCLSCFDQALPCFNPSTSSTLALLPCSSTTCQDLQLTSCGTGNPKSWPNQTCVYTYSYGDKSVTTGLLDVEKFTFGAGASVGSSVAGVIFGCGIFYSGVFRSNETGIAGFGRGPSSLPSQLKAGNFSHCFTAVTGSKPSTVLLDLPADLYKDGRGAVQTTPLVQTLYYLSLKGITVGSTRLPVPESEFALRNGTTGGTIIDSGTAITSLPPRVYRLVRSAFAAQVKLPVVAAGNATGPYVCFTAPPRTKPDVPKLVLHLEGATLDLPRENYVFEVEDAGNSYLCLAMIEGGDMTTIGNFQQQNMHVLYDLQNNKLSFVPAQCDKL
uniref:Peptidase A1 domain-containing protein n=1 Tax=Oryza brachyantha TaxID=4533 RepID=J3LN85_ORYBR